MLKKSAKISFTESEAASRLGISVEQLRSLVKKHIFDDDEVPENATFRPSDLLLLQMLANRQINPTVH